MKKILILLVGLFILTGCGKKNPSEITDYGEAYDYYTELLDIKTEEVKKTLKKEIENADGDITKMAEAYIDTVKPLVAVVTEANAKFVSIFQSGDASQEEFKEWVDKFSEYYSEKSDEISKYNTELTKQ